MSIHTTTSGIDPEVLADIDAITRHQMEGTPIEPELVQRVHERSRRATQALIDRGVEIDVVKLLHDARDEQ